MHIVLASTVLLLLGASVQWNNEPYKLLLPFEPVQSVPVVLHCISSLLHSLAPPPLRLPAVGGALACLLLLLVYY